MSVRDRDRWNAKYAQHESSSSTNPDAWLVEAVQQIGNTAGPCRHALDIACGSGQNAVWLAQQGWHCDAVDISSNGLLLARQRADAAEVHVNWIEADLDDWIPADGKYDLVVVFRFLDRVSVPRVVRTALRPGGWLIYETFTAAECRRPGTQISNPAFTLLPGEPAALFPGFRVVVACEAKLHDRTVGRFLGRRHVPESECARFQSGP